MPAPTRMSPFTSRLACGCVVPIPISGVLFSVVEYSAFQRFSLLAGVLFRTTLLAPKFKLFPQSGFCTPGPAQETFSPLIFPCTTALAVAGVVEFPFASEKNI